MGFEWSEWALAALNGIEPYEVLQVLRAQRRWPRGATGAAGIRVLTVWGRTDTGRPLIVVARQVDGWDWLIIGARTMAPTELVEFENWEEGDAS